MNGNFKKAGKMKYLRLTMFFSLALMSWAADAKIWKASAVFGGEKQTARMSLDIKIPLDLRVESGITFNMRFNDLMKFSNMLIYFKSGNGWYRGNFEPGDEPGWQKISVHKRDMTAIEGKVEGWSKISVVRIACYRSADAEGNAEIEVSDIKYISSDAKTLVISGETTEGTNGRYYAATFSRTLDAAGIGYAIVGDNELKAEDFAGRKVAVLPYNGSIPEKSKALVKDFIARGGQVVACYTVPDDILAAMGVKRTGWFSAAANGGTPFSGFLRTGTSLAGQPEFVPQTSGFGVIAGPVGKGEIVANWTFGKRKDSGKAAIVRTDKGIFISHVWQGGATAAKIALMQSLFSSLEPSYVTRFAELRNEIEKRRRENEAQLRCVARPGKDERFAVWCHTAYGPASTWDEAVSVLARAGCTDLIANLCWGGHAYYASSVLPVDKSVAVRGDAYELARSACDTYGLKLHVWRVCGNLAGCSKEYRSRMAAQKRLALNFDGSKMDGWVCLSHPANIEVEIASLEELAAKGAQGVHMDYIRYRDANTCFCEGCRERFERFAGREIPDWPKAVRADEKLLAKWNEFRCGNIDTIVKGVYRRVKAKNPKCEVSAAVFPNWVTAPVQVAQRSENWCRDGLLDFVCPMDYSSSVSIFTSSMRTQKKLAGKVPVLPGVGLSCWPDDGNDAGRFARQISAVRAEGFPGWTLFDFNERGYNALKVMAESSP